MKTHTPISKKTSGKYVDEKPQQLPDLSNTRIETERLLLVPVSLDYVDQMFQELTDEITKYMAIFPPESREMEVEFVNKSLEKLKLGMEMNLVILDKQTKEYLGGVGIKNLDSRTPEPGIWTKKSAHGKKIGREAVTALKKWADANLDYDVLVYPVHRDNIPSRKIAESLGGKVVAEEIKVTPSGKELDAVIYHIPHNS